MFGTCISHIVKTSVRPCLGHGIDLICVSVRPVWDTASTQMDES
ncbi:hypothetical protein F383_36045 [Gossypium arboreum]|uniref:Uncharacterized protein n=1 Tax=Gossypium arboreum TaxID=29729 RepID=A0A0B0ND60_GOSAR|nr:hypothetical protein F383_36045 [Gossypium arboreum]